MIRLKFIKYYWCLSQKKNEFVKCSFVTLLKCILIMNKTDMIRNKESARLDRLSILWLLDYVLTAYHLEFLTLKGGSSVSTLVKVPHCWKSP